METPQLLRLVLLALIVLTVPMRNGNPHRSPVIRVASMFLPYLWGMETNFPQYAKQSTAWFLPYLWGMETLYFEGKWVKEWRFLPYLWGMETPHGSLATTIEGVCSYRTYEEWKRICSIFTLNHPLQFLPYLWGMETSGVSVCGFLIFQGSYRTYEEWKQSMQLSGNVLSTSFLPYLWGMETFLLHKLRKVLNAFLPYLWGMETKWQTKWEGTK